MGETSRSPYQRGREYSNEIREGNAAHPIVIHAVEEHGGIVQPVLMRVLSSHLTSMDRQIQESLNILEEARKPGQCMNLKSEWAGAKIPGLAVNLPKGLAKDRATSASQETGENTQETTGEAAQETEIPWNKSPVGHGGSKRIRQPGIEEEGEIEQEDTG